MAKRRIAVCIMDPLKIREENRPCNPKGFYKTRPLGRPPNLYCLRIVQEQTVRNCHMISWTVCDIDTCPQALANEILHHKTCFIASNTSGPGHQADGCVEGNISHHQRCFRMKNDGSSTMNKRKNLISNISHSEKTNNPLADWHPPTLTCMSERLSLPNWWTNIASMFAKDMQ